MRIPILGKFSSKLPTFWFHVNWTCDDLDLLQFGLLQCYFSMLLPFVMHSIDIGSNIESKLPSQIDVIAKFYRYLPKLLTFSTIVYIFLAH
jgi:hypothetical protein